MQKIHNIIEPEFYLEIGVKFGKSLRLSQCPSIGIDPKPRVKSEDFSNATIFNSTSDDFFGYPKCYKNFPQKFIDFAFVDGNHLFEYVLRDFINLEKYSHVDTIIAMDDVLPRSLIEAHRKCLQSSWTADSWKIVLCLRKYRPDLDVLVTNSSPTGLGLVSNLDSNSTVLSDNYDKILNEYLNLSFAKIIGCRDQIMSVVQPDSELLDNFITKRKKKIVYYRDYDSIVPL
ncbi:MAG: class I SAM-dependent methyltransferase, partial [Xenococcus sp. (in: cyanobacteria)]